jgi:hypothetical protein
MYVIYSVISLSDNGYVINDSELAAVLSFIDNNYLIDRGLKVRHISKTGQVRPLVIPDKMVSLVDLNVSFTYVGIGLIENERHVKAEFQSDVFTDEQIKEFTEKLEHSFINTIEFDF